MIPANCLGVRWIRVYQALAQSLMRIKLRWLDTATLFF